MPSAELKLTDLHGDPLLCIVKLVLRKNDQRHALAPPYITCGVKEWGALTPLRLTCRALNKACRDAVEGFNLDLPMFFSLNTSAPFPCTLDRSVSNLKGLIVSNEGNFATAGIKHLLETYPNLIRLEIRIKSPHSTNLQVTKFPSSQNLKDLRFVYDGGISLIEHFLGYQYDCLQSLSLGHGQRLLRIEYKNRLRNVQSLFLGTMQPSNSSTLETNKALISGFARFSKLKRLHLSFANLAMFNDQCCFQELLILSLTESVGKESEVKYGTQAARLGCFPALRELTAYFYDTRPAKMKEFAQMLETCKATLKTLDFGAHSPAGSVAIGILRSVRYRSDFKLKLSAGLRFLDNNSPIPRDWVDACIYLRVNYLVSVFFCNGYGFTNIDRLAELSELRVVKFHHCMFRDEEVRKLLRKPGGLKLIDFAECRVQTTGEDGIRKWKVFDFIWNVLSQTEQVALETRIKSTVSTKELFHFCRGPEQLGVATTMKASGSASIA